MFFSLRFHDPFFFLRSVYHCRVPKGGVFKGGGNWGTLRIPREDWGTLGNIREPPPLGTPPPLNNPIKRNTQTFSMVKTSKAGPEAFPHQVKDQSFGFFSPNNEPLLEREQRESYQCLDWLYGVWRVGLGVPLVMGWGWFFCWKNVKKQTFWTSWSWRWTSWSWR